MNLPIERTAFITAGSAKDLDGYAPLGIASLIAFTRRRYPGLQIRYFRSFDDLAPFAPQIMGISAVSQNWDEAIRLADLAKKNSVPIVVAGGPHITCLPESLADSMDVGILGEGETPFTSLIGKLYRRECWRNLPGICFRQGGSLRINPAQKPISDLDQLPFPALEDVGFSPERAHWISSRGCPYKCSFCSSSKATGRYRSCSAGRLVQDIRRLVADYSIRKLHLFEDLFVADKNRLQRFVKMYKESGLPDRLELTLTVRANLVDEALVRALGSIKVGHVTFGAESNDPEILPKIKPGIKPEDNERALERLSKAGISSGISLIIGFPDQSEPSIIDTYRFGAKWLSRGALEETEVHLLAPFPGTEYFPGIGKFQGQGASWSMLSCPWMIRPLHPSLAKAAQQIVAFDRALRLLLKQCRRKIAVLHFGPTEMNSLAAIAKIGQVSAAFTLGQADELVQEPYGGYGKVTPETLLSYLEKIPDAWLALTKSIAGDAMTGVRKGIVHSAWKEISGCLVDDNLAVMQGRELGKRLSRSSNWKEICAGLPSVEFPDDPLDILRGQKIGALPATDLFSAHAAWISKNR